jgi:4-carboxymuconolactone decarboxylase
MRLPFIPPTDISAKQRPLYEDMKIGIATKYINFATMREDEAILGPWSAWPHKLELGAAISKVTKAMTHFNHLPEIVRQVVILIVGSRFRAAY